MRLSKLNRTVIVTMSAVGMMQVAVDQVVDVVTVRDRFMPASGAVNVARRMARAVVVRRTLIWVCQADLDFVLVHMINMYVV